jgi:hypothetical protein
MATDSAMILDGNSEAANTAPNGRQQAAVINGISASKDAFHDMSDDDDLPLVRFLSLDIILHSNFRLPSPKQPVATPRRFLLAI